MARRRRGRTRCERDVFSALCGYMDPIWSFVTTVYLIFIFILPICLANETTIVSTLTYENDYLFNSTYDPLMSIQNDTFTSIQNDGLQAVNSTESSKEEKPLFSIRCKKDNGPWPANPNGSNLVLGFIMTQKGKVVKERLGLKIPGMISQAITDVNKRKMLPENYKLQIKVHDSEGSELRSTSWVTDMICNNISAFIGPQSSCYVEASVAEAKNVPMISYACTDSKASERKTFARTNPSETYVLSATIATLIHFKWTKFSIIYQQELHYTTMAQTLSEMAEKQNITINHMRSFKDVNEFPDVLATTKENTRIYVLLAHRQHASRAVYAFTFSGLLKKDKIEYMLIFVDLEEFKKDTWEQYIYHPASLDKDGQTNNDCKLRENDRQYGLMIISTTFPLSHQKIAEMARQNNKIEPFCLASDVNFLLKKHVPLLPASYLYDAVMLYASAVSEIYKQAKRLSPESAVDVSVIGRNGTAIANWLTNREYPSILGFNVTMGSDRASQGSYSVYYFKKSEECKKPEYLSTTNCTTHCLIELCHYRKGVLEQKISQTINILDEPLCGYDGSKCHSMSNRPRYFVLGFLVFGVVSVALFSVQKYRHWKYEQEISGLLWRIDKEELKFEYHDYVNESKMSLMSGVSQEGVCAHYVPPELRATYRGTMCCIKTIALDRKQELSRETMKHMRAMREIKHRNVCPFIGAYVEERRLTLVTEYAMRGSLEDILLNEDTKLEELFISSLVHDLLRAMCYLHQSIGSHGNLKSTNCVVTGRWVLQVTDYQLYELRQETYRALQKATPTFDEAEQQQIKQNYLKGCLWKAPELLRLDTPMAPATKEGDVYAFGIILHEIIGRKGPFSTSDLMNDYDVESIVNDVRRGHTEQGSMKRPNTLDLSSMPYSGSPEVMSAMKAAWAEDSKIRPDFKELTARLKKIRKRGNLVDHMLSIMEEHNKNLEGLVRERTQEVFDEKKKTEELLHSMLPSSVATNLCRNIPVEPQSYDSVTIYFSDIVGFTALASASSPYEIVSFLDDLYREFDTTISGFNVYKVETIGDAYMVVSGLPTRNEGRHAGEIASMALELLEQTKVFKITHKPDQTLKLRIGLHTGPVIAGVVGFTMPRYCLFGDTVNTASRMESNGEPLRIHVSKECNSALVALGGYELEERGYVTMKGKGSVLTYWLVGANENAIKSKEKMTGFAMNFLQRVTDDGPDIRRRSPRLSIELRDRRTPSICSRTTRSDMSPMNGMDSPPVDFAQYHRQRLTQNHRANSLESSNRGGFLTPSPGCRSPTLNHRRTNSNLSVCDRFSLNELPINTPTQLSPLQPTNRIRFSSTPPLSHRRSIIEDEIDDEVAELRPILDDSDAISPTDFSISPDIIDECDQLSCSGSIDSRKPSTAMRNLLNKLLPKNKRDWLAVDGANNAAEKVSLNGLQRSESHV